VDLEDKAGDKSARKFVSGVEKGSDMGSGDVYKAASIGKLTERSLHRVDISPAN
jgi:hypothetical protein